MEGRLHLGPTAGCPITAAAPRITRLMEVSAREVHRGDAAGVIDVDEVGLWSEGTRHDGSRNSADVDGSTAPRPSDIGVVAAPAEPHRHAAQAPGEEDPEPK